MYYSVRIPWSEGGTKWHPRYRDGLFSILTRGAFMTEIDARAWADSHLGGLPYTVVEFNYGV